MRDDKEYNEENKVEVAAVQEVLATQPELVAVNSAQGVVDFKSPKDQQALDALSQIKEIQPDNWENLSEGEKRVALQKVETQMAEIQGRPSAELKVAKCKPGELGRYDGQTNQIVIAEDSFKKDGVKELVNTTVHEGRHAFQQYAIQHPEAHDNSAEIEAWRENLKPGNYIRPEVNFPGYLRQPVEADAWAHGDRVANTLYGDK